MSLATNDADQVRLRAQAEAFKVGDIMANNQVTYLIYTPTLDVPDLRPMQTVARVMMESAGAEVIPQAEELADRVRRLVAAR